uniref:Transcription regulator-like n=1 Tax=Prorocentrum minimum TaxID=39449 RepID=E8Z6U6_PROMN|nr:transcription regulator-like [Prorocentrum minimum]
MVAAAGRRLPALPDPGGLLALAGDAESGQHEKRERLRQRLACKQEIREIERRLKAHRKQACLSKEELADLAGRMGKLKVELESAKSLEAMSLQLCRTDGGEPASPPLSMAMGDRVSIMGLSHDEASELIGCFRAGSEPELTGTWGSRWQPRTHVGLRRGALSGGDLETLRRELERFAALPPHALAWGPEPPGQGHMFRASRFQGLACRRRGGGQRCLERGVPDDRLTACLLHAVGVKARGAPCRAALGFGRWRCPSHCGATWLENLKLRDFRENVHLAAVFTEVEVLYPQEFDDDLVDLLSEEGVRMGILLASPMQGERQPEPRDFYGFVIYKFWGPPLKTMSISRVAVPSRYRVQGFGRQLVRWAIERAKQKPRHECARVSLLATSSAVPFYERLNFTATSPEDSPSGAAGPELPGSVWMEYSYAAASRR